MSAVGKPEQGEGGEKQREAAGRSGGGILRQAIRASM